MLRVFGGPRMETTSKTDLDPVGPPINGKTPEQKKLRPPKLAKFQCLTPNMSLKHATPNHLVLVWHRHFWVKFTSRQEKMYKTFEFLDQMSCTCSSDYSGAFHVLFFFIWGSLYCVLGIFVLGPQEAGRERRNSEFLSRIQIFPFKHQCARNYQVWGRSQLLFKR